MKFRPAPKMGGLGSRLFEASAQRSNHGWHLIVGRHMAEKQFVNLGQLIERFPFLKRSRIYYLTNVKGIPFYRVGRSLVFEVNEIHHWVESGRVTQEQVQ